MLHIKLQLFNTTCVLCYKLKFGKQVFYDDGNNVQCEVQIKSVVWQETCSRLKDMSCFSNLNTMFKKKEIHHPPSSDLASMNIIYRPICNKFPNNSSKRKQK